MPLTGAVAAAAKQALDGYNSYFDATNAKGGVNGHKVDYITQDDGFVIANTIAGLRQLIQQDNVSAVTAFGSSNVLAAVPLVTQLKVPMIAPFAFTTSLYDPVIPYAFPVFPGGADELGPVVKYFQAQGFKKYVIVTRDDPLGPSNAKAYAAGLDPGELVDTLTYPQGATDVTTIAQHVIADNPDMILMYTTTPEFALWYKTLKSLGYTKSIFSQQASADPGLPAETGDSAMNNVYGSVFVDQFSNSPGWQQYVANLKKYAPNANPDAPFTIEGYLSAMVIVGVLKNAKGNFTPAGLETAAQTLTNLSTDGLTPPISFNETSHIGTKSELITEWKSGTLVAVTPFAAP